MILVDSNVIIDSTKKKNSRLRHLFAQLPVAICGVIWAEVASGANTSADRIRIDKLLHRFAYYPFAETLWMDVATNLDQIRSAGFVVPFNDAVIATLAIRNGIEVWTRDRHFPAIQRALPQLCLYAEPP